MACGVEVSAQLRLQTDNINVKPPQNLAKHCFPEDTDLLKEREFFIRCLVFGAEKTGKHSLISANFNTEKEPSQSYIRNDIDFLPRTHQVAYNTKRYHFWTFRVNDKSLTKEQIWRAYYKSASAFVFVYDISNAESFMRLESAVQSVLKVVPEGEFYGVLIGNKNDLEEKREVSHDAAVSFQLKYGMAQFFETNQKEEEASPKIIHGLDPRLKLTFESI